MRIKIKNPYTAEHRQTMLTSGIFSLLALAVFGAAAYLTGGFTQAWQTLGITINDICQDDLTCRLGFAFIFKLAPLVFIGIFVFSLYEKRTKFRTPAERFTHINFNADGVLLENSRPAKSVFFPYTKTLFVLTATAHHVTIKGTPVTAVSTLEFTFTQKGDASVTVCLLPPREVIPFLCKILDKRGRFARFSYEVRPLDSSYQNDAEDVRKKLDKYCQTGFLSAFNSPSDRRTMLVTGLALMLAGIIIPLVLYLPLKGPSFLYGIFFLLIPLGAYAVTTAAKDIRLERQAAKRNQRRF